MQALHSKRTTFNGWLRMCTLAVLHSKALFTAAATICLHAQYEMRLAKQVGHDLLLPTLGVVPSPRHACVLYADTSISANVVHSQTHKVVFCWV